MNEMQTTMPLETCCRCGQAIGPDEPYIQSASVDIDEFSRKAFSFPVKSYHLTGRCYDEHKAGEAARRETLKAV